MKKIGKKRKNKLLQRGALCLLLITSLACDVQKKEQTKAEPKKQTDQQISTTTEKRKEPPAKAQTKKTPARPEKAQTKDPCVAKRIAARTFPSAFEVWNPIENQPNKSDNEKMAMHDLALTTIWTMELNWAISSENPYKGISTTLTGNNNDKTLKSARTKCEELHSLNPNLLLLCGLKYREAQYVAKGKETSEWQQGEFPYDSELWLRDEEEKLCPGWGKDTDGNGTVELDEIQSMLIDFRKPEVHEILARKALALKESGIFDGIILNWWNEDQATTGRWPNWNGTHLTSKEETAARIAMLKAIREKVGNDFLIMVISNDRKVPKSAPYINGLFMECYKDHRERGYEDKYIHNIEETLTWAEKNLREPRVNCLEGWRVISDYNADQETRIKERNSPENIRWMRLFTTLCLTHSDGYALYGDGNALPTGDHLHNWYDFWDADLGKPMPSNTKEIDGYFIREFTKGSAVYNPPGNKDITITFDTPRKSAATGLQSKKHSISEGDGDLFLRL